MGKNKKDKKDNTFHQLGYLIPDEKWKELYRRVGGSLEKDYQQVHNDLQDKNIEYP